MQTFTIALGNYENINNGCIFKIDGRIANCNLKLKHFKDVYKFGDSMLSSINFIKKMKN